MNKKISKWLSRCNDVWVVDRRGFMDGGGKEVYVVLHVMGEVEWRDGIG